MVAVALRSILVIGCLYQLATAQARASCPDNPVVAITRIEPDQLHLGKLVLIHTAGLAKVSDANLCSITLRLNGHEFLSLPSKMDPMHEQIVYQLERVPQADQESWRAILGMPHWSGMRKVTVSIGLSGKADFASGDAVPQAVFVEFSSTMALGAALFVLACLWAFIKAARSSEMLRDQSRGPAPAGSSLPYSLGLCQMALWFWLILVAFCVIFIITGDYNGIVTAQGLTLLGISSATGLAAVAISGSQATAPPGGAAPPPQTHVSLWNDLMTDDSGYVLHRIQVVIWTVILAAISLYSVYRNLSLPAFDDNLLTMMAISGGAYVGFKVPEKQT